MLQGLAAGIQMPQVIGTIQQIFTGKERGRAFGLFGATIGIATAFGPTLGGLMIALGGAQDGWRWIFWMNVPLCLAVLAGVVFGLATAALLARETTSLAFLVAFRPGLISPTPAVGKKVSPRLWRASSRRRNRGSSPT